MVEEEDKLEKGRIERQLEAIKRGEEEKNREEENEKWKRK